MRKENIIWEQLKVIAPGTVDDFKAATTAMDAGNYDEAVRLYEAVRKKAPEFDPELRRLGTSLALKGDLSAGLDLLEQAVQKNRTPENLISLANFLAYPGEIQPSNLSIKLPNTLSSAFRSNDLFDVAAE